MTRAAPEGSLPQGRGGSSPPPARRQVLKVRVYAPPLGDHGPIDEDGFVELPAGACLDDLLRLLRVPFRGVAPLFCMVNHEKARGSRPLAEGDTVSFISLISGG